MITRNSPLPFYKQIANNIREKIQEGEFKPGDSIGTLKDLEDKFNVSSITVRKAMGILEKEGFLVSTPGKGTFVREGILEDHLPHLRSLSEVMIEKGMKPQIEVLEFKRTKAPKKVAELFKDKGSDYLYIKRLHVHQNIRMALAEIYLPWEIGKKLMVEDVERKTIYNILENKLGIKIGYGEQLIKAQVADENLAKLLGVKKGSPILKAERFTKNKEGDPVEFIILNYRADFYQFKVNLHRFNWADTLESSLGKKD